MGVADGSLDPDSDFDVKAGAHAWLEPIPDSMFKSPEEGLAAKQSVRLAVMTALQELPARQRAVLILRDVVQFSRFGLSPTR